MSDSPEIFCLVVFSIYIFLDFFLVSKGGKVMFLVVVLREIQRPNKKQSKKNGGEISWF